MTTIKRLIFLAALLFAHGANAQSLGGNVGRLSFSNANLSNSTVTATAGNTARLLADYFSDRVYAANYGAACDAYALYDITLTHNANTVSSASRPFVAGDVGDNINVYNGSTALHSTIASVGSGVAHMADNFTGSSTNPAGSISGLAYFYHTDDTAHLQAALDAMYAKYPSGSMLVLPHVGCAASQLSLHRNQLLGSADGHEAALLLQTDYANKTMILSENQPVLTGTALNYGPTGFVTASSGTSDSRVPSYFGLKDVIINGNSTRVGGTNTSGVGVDFYGPSQFLLGVVQIQNTAGYCLHTESSNLNVYSLNDPRAMEEGRFNTVRLSNCGVTGGTAYGYYNQGPNDTVVDNMIISGTAGYSMYQDKGGMHWTKLHEYYSDNRLGLWLHGGGSFQEVYTDQDNADITGVEISLLHQDGCLRDSLTLSSLPCLNISGKSRIDMHYWNWSTINVANNVIAINIPSGADATQIGLSYGSDIVTTATGTTNYKIRGNFYSLPNLTSANESATGGVCMDFSGSYNKINYSSFGCKTHFAYTPGFDNTISLNSYVAGGETFQTGTFASTDTVHITNGSSVFDVLANLTISSMVSGGVVINNSSGQLSSATLGTNLSLAGSTLNAASYYAWAVQSGTSAALASGNGYIPNNAALVTYTLPVSAAVGGHYKIAGLGAGGWKIAQNAGQITHFGNVATTSGAAGYIASQNQYDGIEIVCVTANTTFVVVGSQGNMTVN